jgi:hypothetical protein
MRIDGWQRDGSRLLSEGGEPPISATDHQNLRIE